MPSLLVDDRWSGAHGIGRYAAEIMRRLPPFDGVDRRLAPASPWSVLMLAETCRRRRPAVFYSPSYMGPLYGPTPTVLTIHDLIPLEPGSGASARARSFFKWVLPTVARRAAQVATVSQYSRERLLERFRLDPARIKVIPCGVDPAFSPETVPCRGDRPYFLVVAPSRPHKNRRAVLRTLARSALLQEFDLRIVGDGLTPDERAGLEPSVLQRVRVHTRVAERDLPPLYRGAAALVHPALLEGFGLPVLEALACGTPVVCSDRAALPEVGGDAALYFDPADLDELQSALERLACSPDLGRQLASRGPEQARRFSWDCSARLVCETLEQMRG